MASSVPVLCVVDKPTPQSVMFAGVYINLVQLSLCTVPPVDHSYLSRIFKGNRSPTLAFTRRIADALGMDWAAFIEALQQVQQAHKDTGRRRDDGQG